MNFSENWNAEKENSEIAESISWRVFAIYMGAIALEVVPTFEGWREISDANLGWKGRADDPLALRREVSPTGREVASADPEAGF